MSNETVTYSLETILKEIKDGIKEVNHKADRIDQRLTKLEIGQAELKGEIKALDERLSTKIDGLTARVAYQEFTNRGILIALVVAILGGAAKLFGFIGNP
jgi:peptidoglycan hydrolase CwlO-like protein